MVYSAAGHFVCESVGKTVFVSSFDIVKDNLSQKLQKQAWLCREIKC